MVAGEVHAVYMDPARQKDMVGRAVMLWPLRPANSSTRLALWKVRFLEVEPHATVFDTGVTYELVMNTRSEALSRALHVHLDAKAGTVKLAAGEVLDPARSRKVFDYSPTGFAWGYSGAGPTQLALALLLEAGCSDETAKRWCIRFRDQVVAKWPHVSQHRWVDVARWLELQGAPEGSCRG